jgi:hypothetical protein
MARRIRSAVPGIGSSLKFRLLAFGEFRHAFRRHDGTDLQ